jgi:hypothetical protein
LRAGIVHDVALGYTKFAKHSMPETRHPAPVNLHHSIFRTDLFRGQMIVITDNRMARGFVRWMQQKWIRKNTG